MKKFLVRLGLFALIPLLFSLGVCAILEARYYRPYLKTVPSGTQMVLLGDSHGAALEDLLSANQLFNFSHPSDSYHDMLRKLRHTIRTVPNLKVVLVTADDHTLSAYRERLNNGDRSIFYTVPGDPDPLISSRYEDFKRRVVWRWLSASNAKGRDVAVAVMKSWFRTSPPQDERERDWSRVANRDEESRGRVERQYPGNLSSVVLGESLEEIVTTARIRGITVIGVKFPLSGDYLKHLADKGYGADSVLRRLNVDVLDYRNLYAANDSLFKDQDHLNRRGARLFADRLRGDLTPRLQAGARE